MAFLGSLLGREVGRRGVARGRLEVDGMDVQGLTAGRAVELLRAGLADRLLCELVEQGASPDALIDPPDGAGMLLGESAGDGYSRGVLERFVGRVVLGDATDGVAGLCDVVTARARWMLEEDPGLVAVFANPFGHGAPVAWQGPSSCVRADLLPGVVVVSIAWDECKMFGDLLALATALLDAFGAVCAGSDG